MLYHLDLTGFTEENKKWLCIHLQKKYDPIHVNQLFSAHELFRTHINISYIVQLQYCILINNNNNIASYDKDSKDKQVHIFLTHLLLSFI